MIHLGNPGLTQVATVTSRQFGTGIIEVRDQAGDVHRLNPGEYHADNNMPPSQTHGRQAVRGADLLPSLATAPFTCPEWPLCGCPDGTTRPDYPGLKKGNATNG
ncbi:MAG TPA: hypothetical protein DIT67_01545 [Octadecabacter sp.]|nr:hypothetical protein [Octadecabacter sp.]